MRPLKIYLASSWRNKHYETVLQVLRFQGYETYDFKHPEDQSLSGFSWENLHKDVKSWTCEDFKQNLHHPEATNAFEKTFVPCTKQITVYFFFLVVVLPIQKQVG